MIIACVYSFRHVFLATQRHGTQSLCTSNKVDNDAVSI